MKKFLLLSGIFLFINSVESQTSVQNICVPKRITGGPNAFGTGGGITTYRQNCLSYNSDLNAVLWIHRASPSWQFPGYNSGSIQATWLNVANGVWDSTIVYYDSGSVPTNPARYPGGVFYNPVGNASVANTYVVSSGPCLPGNGTSWGSYHSARKLTGTTADQTMPGIDLDSESPNTGMWGGSTQFINYDMQQVGTKVFVGGEATDTTTSGNANHNSIHGGIIGKCDFSSGNPVWSYDSIIPPFYYNGNGSGNGYATDGSGGRIAFSPDGTVGYWVAQGRLATDYGNSADSMLAPMVYKTTNGGNSWFPVLQGFDWSNQHPELLKNIGYVFGQNGARHFRLNYKHGFDVTVDSIGTLHLVTSLTGVYGDGAQKDSLIFSNTYDYDYINHHPIIWDLMTDGTTWKTLMVDSIMSSYVGADPAIDTTASANPWGNAGTFLAYGARIQISRSVTGGKIFYSWADSDPIITSSIYNIEPDIHTKSYDLSQQKVTPTFNTTDGLTICYFHYMSDISYFDNGSGKWISPVVYTADSSMNSGNWPYNGTGPVSYGYSDCSAIANSDYTNTANVISSATSASCTPSVSFIMHQDSVNPQPGVWYVSAYYSPQVTNAVWYWGDGTSTAGMSPGHNYASAGQYNICVTAYSACGDSAVACQNDSLYRNNQNNNPNSVISVTVLNENGVGIKTISQSQFVSIYPNPSTGIFTLQLKNISSGDSKAKIYVTNVLGEVVYLAEERLGNNSFSKEIDLQSAANGTYFVKAVVGSKIYNSKITISR